MDKQERKNMGDLPKTEVVAPQRSGKKATVVMQVEMYIEVNETDDWNDMVEQAKTQLRERIYPTKTFHPFRSKCDTIHNDVEVEELKYHTIVRNPEKW